MFGRVVFCTSIGAVLLTACGASGKAIPLPPATPTVGALATRAPTGTPESANATPTIAAPTVTPTSTVEPAPTETAAVQTPKPGWFVYHDAEAGFSIQVPDEWVQDSPGCFSISLEDSPTNLYLKEIAVRWWGPEWLCNNPAAGGGEEMAAPQQVVVNGLHFTLDQGADQGMNKFHELSSYSTLHGDVCVNLTFKLHSVKPGVYDVEPPAFNRKAEEAVFTAILHTLQFDHPITPPVTGSATSTPRPKAACIPRDDFDYPHFVAALECALYTADARIIAPFYYPSIEFQDCPGATCGEATILWGPGGVASLNSRILPLLQSAGPDLQFEDRDKDVSTLFESWVAEHALCAFPSTRSWYVCFGSYYMDDPRSRYAIRGVMLQSP